MPTLRLSLLLAALAPFGTAAAEPDGAALYKARCASCHGANGEGTKRHKNPLEGDLSVAQLADLVRKTMPENDPGSLTPAEATAVSTHVHGSFYSAVARERNRPARVALARLTARETRNALADLVGSFRTPLTWGRERGLKAEYYKGRRLGRGNLAFERVDPQVRFDFGTEAPEPGKTEPHEFSIRWAGSLLAPDTGSYEFVVRTEHAARLWVNDLNRPLIDAWVKSGKDTEYRGTIFLIGGRPTPLRLEFTKAKQGVDDSKKGAKPPPSAPASVALLWKRSNGTLEVVPTRQLATSSAPETFACATLLPPDDRSYGWERGTTVSRAWDQATTDAALETAAYVAARLPELAGVRDDASDRMPRLKAFARTFAERAVRRPLSAAQVEALVERPFAAAKDPQEGIERVVLRVLKSPLFLYREVGGGPDGFDVAARLSFGLWDGMPDKELRDAAAAGRLSSKEQIAAQAQRLLADPRATAKLRGFLLTWVRADAGLDLAKDAARFPGFDAAAAADLRTSLELFFDDILASEKADYRRLLLDDEVFLNGRLAKLYGIDRPPDADFARVRLDGGRAGVLTHPYTMTAFAHASESSPIHRGVFLARGILGQALRPPPEAVTPLPPELHPSLTTRERVLLQTKPAACATCHGVINPLGFTLEHFDAVGRYRQEDHGKPVDATGSYRTRAGPTVTLRGARELATFLADSDEAHAAFVEQLFHALVRQPARAYGPTTLDDLRRSFAANGFDVRRLAADILAATALYNPSRARSAYPSRARSAAE